MVTLAATSYCDRAYLVNPPEAISHLAVADVSDDSVAMYDDGQASGCAELTDADGCEK